MDSIDMCMSCGIAVEKGRKCPRCKAKLARVESRVFQAIMTLRDKGYVPVMVKRIGSSKSKAIKIWFDGYSAGCGVHGEMDVGFENDMPTCSTKPWSSREPYSLLVEWADEASSLERKVPFNRGLCKRCAKQKDDDWYAGICNCPVVSGVEQDLEFEHGIPEKCTYLTEQTVTAEGIKKEFLEGISERLGA